MSILSPIIPAPPPPVRRTFAIGWVKVTLNAPPATAAAAPAADLRVLGVVVVETPVEAR